MTRVGGLPECTPKYIVETMGSRSFEVVKIGFFGGTERIAVYNYQHIADEVAKNLNYYARSEVYGRRKNGNRRDQGG